MKSDTKVSNRSSALDILYRKEIRVVVILAAVYVAAQMIADIASLKIGVVAGNAVDMGTFIYPITFTLRDLAHKTLGKRNTQLLIVIAAVVNAAMVSYFLWASSVENDPNAFGASEFNTVFSPLWRIVVASIVAEVVSELLDTETYHWFVTKVTTKYQWARVLVSNAVSVPLDNIIFVLLAFSPFYLLGDPLVESWTQTREIFVANLTVKFAVTLCSLPLIYLIADRRWDDA